MVFLLWARSQVGRPRVPAGILIHCRRPGKPALAIYFMHYNFARIHSTIRCSPAMAAGVTSHLWSVAEIANLLPVEAPKKRGPYKKQAA